MRTKYPSQAPERVAVYQARYYRTHVASRRANTVAFLKANPEYASWAEFNARCRNPKHRRYADYGGRGITVFWAWRGRGGYKAFIAHLKSSIGRRPTPPPRLTLDRIDNDGDYEPGNLRWATYSEQRRNQRAS
jgi:hypothetical protein